MPDASTPPTSTAPVLFACERLSCRLTVSACAKRWATANGAGPAMAKYNERYGTKPIDRVCVGCPIGAQHHRTGEISGEVSRAAIGAPPPLRPALAVEGVREAARAVLGLPAPRPAIPPPAPKPAAEEDDDMPENDTTAAPRKRRSYERYSDDTRAEALRRLRCGGVPKLVCSALGIKRPTLELWIRTWRAEGKLAPVAGGTEPEPEETTPHAPATPEEPLSPDDVPTVPSRRPLPPLEPEVTAAPVREAPAPAPVRQPYLVDIGIVVRLAREAGRGRTVVGTQYIVPLPGGRFAAVIVPADFGKSVHDITTFEAMLPEITKDLTENPPIRMG